VPSLLGNFAPSTSTPAVDQHPSPAKKRRRSSTTTAANTKKEQQKPATELHLSEKIMQQPLVEENKGITVKESQMEKPKADENQLLGKKMKGEEEQKEQAEKKEEMKSPAQVGQWEREGKLHFRFIPGSAAESTTNAGIAVPTTLKTTNAAAETQKAKTATEESSQEPCRCQSAAAGFCHPSRF
jgi:hypothetical protein